MAKAKTLESALALIDALITEGIEYNGDTRDIIHELYSARQRKRRSNELEKAYAELKGAKRTNVAMVEVRFSDDDFQKKTVTEVPQQVVVDSAEVVDAKDQTSEAELLDIVTDGVDAAKRRWKNPKAFANKLRSLGVTTDATTHAELYAAAKCVIEGLV
jgi:hypothetical protein